MSFSYSLSLFKDLRTMLTHIWYAFGGEVNKNTHVQFLYCLLVHCPLVRITTLLLSVTTLVFKLKIVPDTVEALGARLWNKIINYWMNLWMNRSITKSRHLSELENMCISP